MSEALNEWDDHPLAQAYLSASELLIASSKRNPIAKLTGFRKWTARLDRQEARAGRHPDFHLLRMMVQSHAPSFLGYNDSLESDCVVVRDALEAGFWKEDPVHEAFARTQFQNMSQCS
jgi:hypothetical protein